SAHAAQPVGDVVDQILKTLPPPPAQSAPPQASPTPSTANLAPAPPANPAPPGPSTASLAPPTSAPASSEPVSLIPQNPGSASTIPVDVTPLGPVSTTRLRKSRLRRNQRRRAGAPERRRSPPDLGLGHATAATERRGAD